MSALKTQTQAYSVGCPVKKHCTYSATLFA